MKQSDAFLSSEGNAWFERNQCDWKAPMARRELSRWCEPFKDGINNILEIGAGSGFPLAFLADSLDSRATGIEPSQAAVENWVNAKSRVDCGKGVSLIQGVASELPFEDGSFDVVGFGFCLYLVDRGSLFRSISEADRVLRDGGLLYIEDFDPSKRYSNTYIHMDGIRSFKSDYTSIFLASGHYCLVSKCSYSHSSNSFDSVIDERVSMNLMYKQEAIAYE